MFHYANCHGQRSINAHSSIKLYSLQEATGEFFFHVIERLEQNMCESQLYIQVSKDVPLNAMQGLRGRGV
jgi:hypothetical protein